MATGTLARIEAAGGVVWRPAKRGVEILVVHRPKYDDWSLPKGKLEPGESAAAAARREVAEETGMVCRLGAELVDLSYRDRKGRPKRIRFWAMKVQRGRFRRNDEVDAVRWISPARASDLLSARDADVVAAFVASRQGVSAART